MNDQAPKGGGRGESSAYNLDIQQIDEASRTDFEKVSEMETRRDGWKEYRDMMSEMKSDIEAKLPDLEDNYDSAAGKVYAKALKSVIKKTEQHHELAETNHSSTDSIISEVKRVRPLIKEIMDDRALAIEHQNELKSQPQDGSDAFSNALEDTQSEARRTFSESNSTYSSQYAGMNPPPKYDGPVYTGRKPETPLDGNYQYAYFPDNTPYRPGPVDGAGGTGLPDGQSGSGGSAPQPDSTSSDAEGPQLQNPGGTTSPGNAPPTSSTVPSGGSSGPGSFPPSVMPGGNATGPSGGRPISAPGGPRTTPATGGARPTPNMTTRPSTSGMGRQSGPISGRPPGTNAAPKNSMLPNQRQAASGRSPISGSGRTPGGVGGAKGARGSTPASSTTRPRTVPSSGRGGVLRGTPNRGFEETLYRNTRAGRTVPGVIKGAKSIDSGAPSSKPPGQPRVASAGKVIGERKNKSKRGRTVGPKLQAGSLTDTTANTKKDTRHTWQRFQPQPSTEPPAGSLAISRNTSKRPMTPSEIADSKLQLRKKWRKEFYASKQEPALEPASELFGGTEGKVTRTVIRGAGRSRPVERREAGARFSTFGWERDD